MKQYDGMLVAANSLAVLGVLHIAAGVVWAIYQSGKGLETVATLLVLAASAGAITTGVVLIGLGLALTCLRDIAINSAVVPRVPTTTQYHVVGSRNGKSKAFDVQATDLEDAYAKATDAGFDVVKIYTD